MKRILLVGSQHGNELLGEQLYGYIKQFEPQLLPSLTFVVANPLARSLGLRYTESDMNRSYDGSLKTYESHMAQGLVTHIAHSQYDLVLDHHTTKCVQPPCLLVAPHSTATQFLSASSVERIVTITHDMVNTSLIGVVPHAVSIEVQRQGVRRAMLAALASDIQRYLNNKHSEAVKTKYEVYDLLRKDEISPQDAEALENFTKSRHGFYPILVGNNSYRKNTHYLGFKARKT